MSWRDAPLYVEALALTDDLHARLEGWTPAQMALLGGAVAERARDLLDAVSLALTFPDERARELRRTDKAIVRLRLALRLATRRGWLSEGGARVLHGRLNACGRMTGGWRRRVRLHPLRAPPADPGG